MSRILYLGNPVLSSRKDCKNPLGLGVLQTKSANFAVRGSILRGFPDSGPLQTLQNPDSGRIRCQIVVKRNGGKTYGKTGKEHFQTPARLCRIHLPRAAPFLRHPRGLPRALTSNRSRRFSGIRTSPPRCAAMSILPSSRSAGRWRRCSTEKFVVGNMVNNCRKKQTLHICTGKRE